MKTIFKLLIALVLMLSCMTLNGQNENWKIKCSDFIIGLTNDNFLRERLNERGFVLVPEKETKSVIPGTYEKWSNFPYYTIYTQHHAENTPQHQIWANISTSLTDVPNQLLTEIQKSFPHKELREEKRKEILCGDIFYTATKNIFVYSRDSDSVTVSVWFDGTEYYFLFER